MVSVSLAAMLAVAFVSCKADENTCAAGTPCPIEMDPEVGANLNLLQTSIHLHSEVDAEKTRMETDLKTMQNLKDQCDTWEKTDEFCKDGSTCCEGYGCGGMISSMQCVPCDWKDYVFTTDSCKTGDAPGGGAGDPFAGTNCELLMHAMCITQGDRCHYSRATQTCLPGKGDAPGGGAGDPFAAPSAPPSPGPPSPGAKSADCGSEGLTQAEVQEMLDWHNKFRCAVGVPPIEWDGALQCQAQDTQNKIGKFSHSKSYDLEISSGENLATGTSMSMTAWMWFTEYTQADCSTGQGDKCGHFTAMVWKSSTHLGCGIQRDGQGVVRCQYAASPPNYAGQYTSNVPKFQGEESKFQKCGLTIEETKQKVEQFKGWGILHPIAPYDSSLGI